MAVGTTGITPAANFLPTQWADELSEATQAATVLSDLVDRSYENEMRFGRVLAIPDRSNPAIRMKTEDTSATWSNITETQQTLTINKQAYAAFLVEDIAELQAKYDVRSQYTDAAGYSIVAFVEGDLTSGMASLPNNFSAIYGTLGADPSDDDILNCKTSLDKADVPMQGRFMYVSPGTYNGLLKVDKFTRDNYGAPSNAITEAKVGSIYGMPVYMSTLVYNNPSGGAAAGQSYNWICHKRGVALVMQRAPQVHTQYVILETAWGVLIDTIYNFAERLIAPKTLGGGTSDDKFNACLRAS